MKHILALPTYQEIWSCEELGQFDFGKFDLGHPVIPAYSDLGLCTVKNKSYEIELASKILVSHEAYYVHIDLVF